MMMIMMIQINPDKTKYTVATGKRTIRILQNLKVIEFAYLGSLLTYTNETSAEIKNSLFTANKAYFDILNRMSSTLIKLVVMYGSET